MKICLIILAVIGLLKVVSLFILTVIETYYPIKKINIYGINRNYGIYKQVEWYIIPTISFSKTGKYFEIMAYWLCFQYYSSYSIDKGDEK